MSARATTTGAFSFQNAFFYLQWANDADNTDTSDPVSSSLVTMTKTRRKTKLHPHKQRSKYVCRPERVVEAGNHFIWEFIPGYGTFNVGADQGIMHHYRVCEFGGDDCIKAASTVDTTAFRYRKRLVKRVRDAYGHYKDRCGLMELVAVDRRSTSSLSSKLSRRSSRVTVKR